MRLGPRLLHLALLSQMAAPALAQTTVLEPSQITEWRAVYGQVEARDRIAARAQISGILVDLTVVEGDVVTAGQPIGLIKDQKLAFQMTALDAQRSALAAQLENANAELERGKSLLKQGVTTTKGLEALQTQVDVLNGQLAAMDAQADVVGQQITEGTVLAPAAGRVLDVPVSKGAVVMPGEGIATIGAGGTFLRLSIPERHAPALHQGDAIDIAAGDTHATGTLSRIYPLIENGRVVADVDLAGLNDAFIDARVLVRLPIGTRAALMVPASAISHQAGLDFVAVEGPEGPVQRAVVPGVHQTVDGVELVEILSGLAAGDHILTTAPVSAGSSDE